MGGSVFEKRGYAAIALDNPKSDVNVGSALRACAVYGVSLFAFSGKRIKPGATDTYKAYRQIPTIRCDDILSCIPYDCVPVAVDLVEDAISLVDYKHPQRAFYIFGVEDATLGDRILSKCRDRVYVPTNGCMNLAATVNVILYDRMAKGG